MAGIIATLLGIAAVGTAAVRSYFAWQGDADIVIPPNQVTQAHLRQREGHWLLEFVIPVVNQGKQKGFLLEIMGQIAYGNPRLDRIDLLPRLRLKKDPPRSDWYLEALLMNSGFSHPVEASFILHGVEDMEILARECPQLPLLLHYKYVGRDQIETRVTELNLDLQKLWEGRGC